MKSIIGLSLICITLLSCNNKLESRQYKSLDEYTGGFNNFELNLKETGKFELYIETSRSIPTENNGDTWASITKTAYGDWRMVRSKIAYDFYDLKSSIDSVFDDSDFIQFKQKKLLYFSTDLDTAYIYEIPCLRVKSSNKNAT